MKKRVRYRGRNRHHLTARSRGGTNDPSNLLLLTIERHVLLHKLFGNRTLDEIISVLTRLKRWKEMQDGVLHASATVSSLSHKVPNRNRHTLQGVDTARQLGVSPMSGDWGVDVRTRGGSGRSRRRRRGRHLHAVK